MKKTFPMLVLTLLIATSLGWPLVAPGTGGVGGATANQPLHPTPRDSGAVSGLPTARPFIALTDYTSVNTTRQEYVRFKNWVDRAVFQHNPGYAYTAADAVIMYALSKSPWPTTTATIA
jgi:hypothetical protein